MGTKRNGWLVFFLGLVTLTVWWVLWMFQINRELKNRGMARAAPVLHAILYVFPLLSLIPNWRTAAALRTLQAETRASRDAKPTLLMVLPYVIPIIGNALYILYVQNSLNEIWEISGKEAAKAKPATKDLKCPSCEAVFEIRKRPLVAELVACPSCGYEGEL